MIKTIVSDFARTLLFPKDPITFLELNEIHKKEIAEIKKTNVYILNDEDLILTEAIYPAVDFFLFNNALMAIYKSLKAKGITLVLLTNGFVHSHPDFKNEIALFNNVFRAKDLGGHSKREAIVYQNLVSKLQIKPEETVFIDDDVSCLAAAEAEGIHTIQFPRIKAYSREQQLADIRKAVEGVEMKLNSML